MSEPTLEDIARQHPGWRVWKGADQMCHASPLSGPALAVRGEDPADLADQIKRAEAFRNEQ